MTDIWYPFYVGDYAKNTQHLSMLEHGAYRQLIDCYFSRGACLPKDKEKLFIICKAFSEQEKNAVKFVINEFFQERKTGYFHQRIEEEIKKSKENKEKQRLRTAAATAARKNVTTNVTNNVTSDVTFTPSPSPSPSPSQLPSESPSKDKNACDFEFFKDTWNKKLTNSPSIQKITQQRKAAINARMKDELSGNRENWTALLEKISSSDFLAGRDGKGFVATFDWVMKPSNMTKIMEGNYDNRAKPYDPGTPAAKKTWKSEADRIVDKIYSTTIQQGGDGESDEGAGESLRISEGIQQNT